MKPRKKRQERRQRSLENDINTNGIDHKGGTFRVFNKETKEQVRGLSWEKATALWRESDNSIILEDV